MITLDDGNLHFPGFYNLRCRLIIWIIREVSQSQEFEEQLHMSIGLQYDILGPTNDIILVWLLAFML